MDSPPERIRVAAFQEVNRNREDRSDDEEVQEGAVADAVGEVVARADGAPDKTGVEFGA